MWITAAAEHFKKKRMPVTQARPAVNKHLCPCNINNISWCLMPRREEDDKSSFMQ